MGGGKSENREASVDRAQGEQHHPPQPLFTEPRTTATRLMRYSTTASGAEEWVDCAALRRQPRQEIGVLVEGTISPK